MDDASFLFNVQTLARVPEKPNYKPRRTLDGTNICINIITVIDYHISNLQINGRWFNICRKRPKTSLCTVRYGEEANGGLE